jgi:hypothetical protein
MDVADEQFFSLLSRVLRILKLLIFLVGLNLVVVRKNDDGKCLVNV